MQALPAGSAASAQAPGEEPAEASAIVAQFRDEVPRVDPNVVEELAVLGKPAIDALSAALQDQRSKAEPRLASSWDCS